MSIAISPQSIVDAELSDHDVPPQIARETYNYLRLAETFAGHGLPPQVLSDLKAAGRPVPRPEVDRFIFVTYPIVNAYAFRHTGDRTVAFCLGLPFILRMAYVSLLADPAFMEGVSDVHYLREPFIGTGKADWKSIVDIAQRFTFERVFQWMRTAPPLSMTESADGRGDFAIVLSLQAFAYVCGHEVGHFAMQHVDEEGSIGVYQELPEVWDSRTHDITHRTAFRHANEMEADTYAFSKLWVGFYRAIPGHRDTRPNHVAMTQMSEGSRLRLWLVSMGVVFLLFDAISKRRASWSHPPPLFRLRHLVSWTEENCHEASRETIQRASDMAQRDLSRIAIALGISDAFVESPGDAQYRDALIDARASRAREFDDE